MAMKRTIAIVEDEPAIRDNYAAAFTREGYVVRTYANRSQAMTAFASRLPDREGLVFGGSRYTFREVAARIDEVVWTPMSAT